MELEHSSTSKIHPYCWGDPNIMKILWQLGLDAPFIMVFELIDLKFNCGNYGPNIGTTQIWGGRDNIEFLGNQTSV